MGDLRVWDFSQIRFTNDDGPSLPRRQRLLFRNLTASDTGDEIVIDGAGLSGQLASALVNSAGVQDGELRFAQWLAVPNDGGGGFFQYQQGITTAGRYGMVFVVAGLGRWVRIQTQNDYIHASWTGARFDGSTNDTAAINLAIEEAISQGIQCVRLPAGRSVVTPAGITASNWSYLIIQGSGRDVTVLLSSSPTTTGGNKGVIDIGQTSVTGFQIKDLTISGEVGVDPRAAPPLDNQVHGIYTHCPSYMNDCVFESLSFKFLSGSGLRDVAGTAGSFQNGYKDLVYDRVGNHGAWFSALGTGSYIQGIAGGSVAENCAGLRVDAGMFMATGVNGVTNNYGISGLVQPWSGGALQAGVALPGGYFPVGTMCVSLGAEARAVLNGNFEDYSRCAVYAEGPCAPKFLASSFFTTCSWPTYIGDYYYIDGVGGNEFDQNNRFFGASGGLGDPKVLATDVPSVPNNAAFRTTQAGSQYPHTMMNTFGGYNKVYNVASGIVFPVPTISQASNFGLGAMGMLVSHMKTASLKFRETFVTATGTTSVTGGRTEFDSTSGNQAAQLPAVASYESSDYKIVKTVAANSVQILPSGGEVINVNGISFNNSTNILTLTSAGQTVEISPNPSTGNSWSAILTSGSWLSGSSTVDVPSIANGASYLSAGITVTGAVLGDHVTAACSIDLAGLQLTAYVSAANTVKFLLLNNSGGAVDLGSATYTVRVVR